MIISQVYRHQKPDTTLIQLVQAAEIQANAITPFQTKNDRHVSGLKRFSNLDSRRCQLYVRAFGLSPNPA
jgi:hypothetical protein